MKLELSGLFRHGCGMYFTVFKVNGVDADISDFGIYDTKDTGNYSCSRFFIPGSFTRVIKDKYKINQREYIQIVDKLEQELTGECDWCS